MKQLFQTAQGTHIIEATGSELANLLLARKAIDAVCDEFTFIIRPMDPPETKAPVSVPPVQQKAPSVKSDRPSVKSDAIPCSVCGTEFKAKRPGQKCCSKPCLNKAYRFAKAKKTKAQAPARKTSQDSGGLEPRICRGCGKTFNPKRKDQNCCKVACRRKLPRTSKAAKKATEQAKAYQSILAKPPPPADRLEAIRAADRRLREKGIAAPSVWSGSDSGIGAPTADDIAEVTRGKQF